MKIIIKTIKNELFEVDVEPAMSIGDVKQAINAVRADFIADRLRLIYKGKVLENISTVAEVDIKEKDNLVCICGAAKAGAPATATASASATTSSSAAPAVNTATTTSTTTTTNTTTTTAPAPAATTAPQPAAQTNPNPGAVADLIAITGASEEMVNGALIAAQGNANMAFEFLTGGAQPAQMQQRSPPQRQQAPASHSSTPLVGTAPAAGPLDKLRRHPQFAQLQQLCQSNPAAIPQVLKIVGDQDPELLASIHANHDEFITMMNEPVGSRPTPAAPPAQSSAPMGGMGGANPLAGMAAQMQNMSAADRTRMAQQMGIPPAQLEQVLGLMSQMPPEQLQAMMGGSMGGMGGTGGAGPRPGEIRVSMSPQDMENVRTIQQLTGATEQEIVQIYISCERNVDQTVSILLDNRDEGGFDAGGDGQGDYDGGDDDMYG